MKWILWILLVLVLIVAIYLLIKFKRPRLDTWNMISGQVGGGKTSSCVCRVISQLKRYYFLWRNKKIKNDYIILSNFPLGKLEKKTGKRYLRIWFKKIYCYDLDVNIIMLQERLPQDEVIIVIDEFNDVASQYMFKDPKVMDNLKEFVSKFRHYTHGLGYGYVIDQCSKEIVAEVRRRIAYCYNMVNSLKIKLLPLIIFEYRKIAISDEVDNVLEVDKGTEEVDLKKMIFFVNPFKYYDSYYLSDRYLAVSKIAKLTQNSKTLKRNDTFKLPKVPYLYYETLKYDNITEEQYIESLKKKK